MGKKKGPGGGKGDKEKEKAADSTSSKEEQDWKDCEVYVRHILCEKKSKKEDALAKLKQGASWDEVAGEFAEHAKGAKGVLGWQRYDALMPQFRDVAFSLQPSSLEKPSYGELKSSQGYHIILVEDKRKAAKGKK